MVGRAARFFSAVTVVLALGGCSGDPGNGGGNAADVVGAEVVTDDVTDATPPDASDAADVADEATDGAVMDVVDTDGADTDGAVMDVVDTDVVDTDVAGMDVVGTDVAGDRGMTDGEGADALMDVPPDPLIDAPVDAPADVAPAMNRPPEIVSRPTTTATPGTVYSYPVDAFDPDGDALTLSVVEGPMGLRAEGLTLTFLPRSDQTGRHAVRIAVTDGRGGRAEQSWSLGVVGLADTTPPTVRITAPLANAVLRAETAVTGTITDANLVGYDVRLRSTDGTYDAVVATGDREVPMGALGSIDPALLAGGFYDIEVVARDLGGNEARASVRVRVDPEDVSPASLQVERTDFDLAASPDGFPFRLRRVYDSTRLGAGDFGRGWWLERVEYRASESAPPGRGPYAVMRGLFGCTISDRPLHQVQVMTPRGTAIFGWEPTLLFTSCDRILPAWRDISNTRATLDCANCGAFGSMSQLVAGNVMNGTAIFDPSAYTVTLSDGITMRIHDAQGLEEVRDRFGHSLAFTRDAIRHDGGEIRLERDPSGRITRATAPGGATITYRYDPRGNLAEAAHASGRRETYEYDGRHLLQRARDGAGAVRLSYEFDRAGRLAASTDETGVRVARTEDVAARTLTLRAATGLVRTLRYDAEGSVVEETDARGGAWRRTYDTAGRVTEETSPLGGVERLTYDPSGRITTMTNALGGRSTYTYGPFDAVASLALSTGAALRRTFAATAPRAMTAETALDGTMQTFTLGGTGFVSRITEARPAGDARAACAVDLGSDRAGRLTATTSSDGERWGYENGPDGLPRTVRRGDERYDYTYDAEGRVTSESAGMMRRQERSYDAEGRLTRMRDALGRETTFTYDPRGRMATQRLPDGATLRYTWSETGELLSRTDAAGAAEVYERNHAGDVTRATIPASGDFRLTIDSLGRPTQIVEAGGERWRNTFDARGRLTRLEDAVGTVWQMRWPDAVIVAPDGEEQPGSPTEVIDPLGRRWAMELDGGGRARRITFPDGSNVQAAYSISGETTSTVDEEGRATRYDLRCNGDLEAVIFPGGARVTYAYNAAGRVVAMVDPRGNRTRFEHDAGGYLTRVTLPGGRSQQLVYDAAGQLSSERLLDGATRRYTHDARGRLTRVEQPDGTAAVQVYGAGELPVTIRDGTSEVRFRRDAQGRVLRADYPGGAFVERTYDSGGRLRSRQTAAGTVRYEYDAAGRLVAMVDAGGGRLALTLDAAGRRTRVAYPNGVVRTNTWDARDRLTRAEDRGPGGALLQSWAYTYDRSGRRLSARDDTGAATTYEYDMAGRLTREARTGAGAYDVRYTLDASGNRTREVRDGAATTYEYDDDDQLVRRVAPDGTTTYRYDMRGRRVAEEGPGARAVRYTWDARDRLSRVVREGDGPTETIDVSHDPLGGLASVRGGAGARRMLFDSSHEPAELVEVGDGAGAESVAWADGDFVLTSGSSRTVALVDALGSPTMLTRGDGTSAGRVAFDAWGRRRAGAYADGEVGFEGHIALGATGLYWMRARVYDSATGTFLSRDPSPPDGSDPRTFNAYLFAAGNPLFFLDPTGRSVISEYAATVRDSVRRVVVLARSYATMIARAAKRICAAIQRALLFPGSRVLGSLPFTSAPGWTRAAIEFFVSTTLFGPEGTLVVQVTRPTAFLRYFGTGGAARNLRNPFTFVAPRGFSFLPRGLYRQIAAILPKWSDLANRTFLRGRAGQIVLVGCTRRQGRFPGGGLQIGLPN